MPIAHRLVSRVRNRSNSFVIRSDALTRNWLLNCKSSTSASAGRLMRHCDTTMVHKVSVHICGNNPLSMYENNDVCLLISPESLIPDAVTRKIIRARNSN